VNGRRAAAGLRAILLDIEGTTTPVAFVTDVLFPYVRKHLQAHLEAHADAPEYESVLARLRDAYLVSRQNGETVPAWADEPASAQLPAVIAYIEWLMDEDRKLAPLKELQGRIWEEGYQRGALVGDVFPDVRPALERWRTQQLQVGVFSSGSVLAQQLLFRHSSAGDLTGLVHWHFDTNVGAKVDPESYRRIARAVGLPPDAVLFLSDVPRELDAARTAGMQVRLVIRPGNAPIATSQAYPTVTHFDEIADA
jgi:enolase-phosphatase E1